MQLEPLPVSGISGSRRAAPRLRSGQAALADRITLAVISMGTVGENRPLAAEHGVVNVLLQEDAEVISAYQVGAAPAAVATARAGAVPMAADRATRAVRRRMGAPGW